MRQALPRRASAFALAGTHANAAGDSEGDEEPDKVSASRKRRAGNSSNSDSAAQLAGFPATLLSTPTPEDGESAGDLAGDNPNALQGAVLQQGTIPVAAEALVAGDTGETPDEATNSTAAPAAEQGAAPEDKTRTQASGAPQKQEPAHSGERPTQLPRPSRESQRSPAWRWASVGFFC